MSTCIDIRRFYTHIEDIGLLLFNDALMITHILTEHHAFERSVKKTYLFKSSVSLVGLQVEDLPDTRCKFLNYSSLKSTTSLTFSAPII